VRGSLVTSLLASHKEDDVSMGYLKDCTKRETFFNDLQYLEVDLAAMRWLPPVKWSSVKRREPSYHH
jgi:hypothetical protein